MSCLNLVRQTDVEPLSEVMWIEILRAGSIAATWLILEISGSLPVDNSFVDVVGIAWLGSGSKCLLQHTFKKWPNLPQLLHGRLNAGHLALPTECIFHYNLGTLVGEWVLLCEKEAFYCVTVGYVQLQLTPDIHLTC